MSIMYFGAPPLNATIGPHPLLSRPKTLASTGPFTWGEYKKAAYSLRWAIPAATSSSFTPTAQNTSIETSRQLVYITIM
ncbi:hypothetical protein F3Y22_tig00111983pilonHSYRG00069 [Hibiscus syriacus]|uniref:Uncharacterized protein n=1 Tax=Hibiscus syriacus TaxID=106335 RepID=A0A6A2XN41_HIBSY|nr:hypothetical protein F3Y22_tig00111983pilonHSYRG00069 [Hibiscus syriacus]